MAKRKILTIIALALSIVVLVLLGDKVVLSTGNGPKNLSLGDQFSVSTYSGHNPDYNPYTDLNFFCIEKARLLPGEFLASGERLELQSYEVEAIATIDKNFQLHLEGYQGENGLDYGWEVKTDSEAIKSNKIMAAIVRMAIQGKNVHKESVTDRSRNSTLKMADGDDYQCAIWEYTHTWIENSWYESNNPEAWGHVYIPYTGHGSEADYRPSETNKKQGEAVIQKAQDMINESSNNEEITEEYYKVQNKIISSHIEKENNYIEIGPFKYNYGGTLTQFDIYYNDNVNSKASSNVKIVTYTGTTAKTIKNLELKSGSQFYLWIPKAELEGKTKLNFAIKTDGGIAETETKIYILYSYRRQELIYVDQTGGVEKEKLDSYILNQEKEVTIQKQDENGKALKVKGIEFKIYNITNEVTPIATLTTDENGSTQKIKLYTNTQYIIKETQNQKYGYKAQNMKDKIAITNGKILESNQVTAKFQITDNATITIKNQKELANVEIMKEGADENKLKGVQFIIETHTKTNKDYRAYLRLYDTDGKFVEMVEGDIIINDNLTATSVDGKTHYKVENKHIYKTVTQNGEEKKVDKLYSELTEEEKSQLTKFVTDENGKVSIHNLEINSGVNLTTGTVYKYDYTAHETLNPNYGYGSTQNTSLGGIATNLELNQTTQIKISNTIDLGNLKLEKYDEDNNDIKLENVGFVIEISPSASKKYAYLALYDQDGNIVPNIKAAATINRQNIANATEYEVRYYCTDKSALDLSEDEKANITTFETASNGTLVVNNLEVYNENKGSKYTYKLIEISNSNYGFIASGQTIDTTLESNSTVSKGLSNKQVLTKISGYVWVENPSGKSNNYDGLYVSNTEENQSKDIILEDLYLTDKDGNVTGLNKTPEKVKAPVEVKLYNKTTKTEVKTQPDKFSKDGKYTFTGVNIEELKNYQVVFKYDGFYYTTTIPNLKQDNGSKVQEVAEERTDLNSLFGTVKDGNKVVTVADASGQNSDNTVTYTKDKDPSIIGHESTVSELNFNTTISANTTETGHNLNDVFDAIKAAADSSVDGIDNVNMGIVLREQPKLALGSDIYSVSVDVNNKQYTYYYNGRQGHYNNLNDDEVGVKFEQESSKNRYTRPVYSSDVQAYNNGTTNMGVSLIYKIQITNQSSTLTSVVREITNYFDSDYTIQEIGLSLSNNEIENELDESIWSADNITENVDVENADNGKSYNSIRIPISENGVEGLALEKGQSKYIYIKYKVSEAAIKGLLSGKSTYHNATEIMSYSTYYGSSTGKQTVNNQEEYFITEQEREGEIYAGIDRSSQPGNIKLKLIEDTRDPEGTKILDTSNYEDDTTSAPALLLEPTTTRKIAGTIFEDTATAESLENNEKLGDGIYNLKENTIDGVKVELYDASTGNIAKYSDGQDAVATTDGKGNYTFGDENVGVLPGDYFIQYTYNNESYIVDTNGNKIKNLNVNDYKSTIITSNVIKSAINNAGTIEFDGTTYPADKWYIIKEADRYSDAIDNIDLRNTLDDDEVKYSTYQNSFEPTYLMKAATPAMDVGIEFTAENEAQVDTTDLASMRNRVETLENVDFGIIERPDADFIIEKKITGLEVTTQTGTNIIPKGDPSNPNASMQYVKTGLDGIVPAEIESKLLQGATLNLEYSITVTNKCQIDYAGDKYYLYGEPDGDLRTPKVEKVVDYLDETMTLGSEQNSEEIWSKATARELLDNGLISQEVYKSINEDDYHILITTQFSELTNPESSETVKLYATKYLATSNTIQEENHVEIIELSGGRTIKESIPGNYDPTTSSPNEPDDDKIKLEIISPTGTTVNYTLYIISAVVMFTILVSGIVIIKKKIIK